MAKPRVFVSSTYYDLKHLRSALESFIESFIELQYITASVNNLWKID